MLEREFTSTSQLNQHIVQLPDHLLERTRWHPCSRANALNHQGSLVLYWMQTAMRIEENPALDVACQLARQLDRPLLIYQGLSARYQYASDRHHTFILEGARDVQAACRAGGLSYALYVEPTSGSAAPLGELMRQACVTIVEDMPTDPHRMFTRAAARHWASPILAVDTACIVPMQLVGRANERAFDYRDQTRQLYKERTRRVWPGVDVRPSAFDLSTLSWPRTELQQLSIADIVAGCDIDHTIPPVTDTRGGTEAGMARWEAFKVGKLKQYAAHRNDPLKQPSSRLSAYLHYGMVSPLLIARQAAELGHEGAVKFLDELLIWRELSYTFCFYRPDHYRWSALPAWARDTLLDHNRDQRTHIYNWETLARAATHDRLWNAAQSSLLRHGELHNNVRMTWGKAILNWCHSPQAALRMAIDLNHRYALDGRDPASYGGLLWCFGQFDRPFAPVQKIFGTVRTRPTGEHLRRLDVPAYEQLVHRPQLDQGTGLQKHNRVAIVGAGLAGCMAARILCDQGISAELFEKSHGPAGRMSTRRAPHADFDHGAQYFTCRDPRFARYVESWLERGLVAAWKCPIAVYAGGARTGCSEAERFVAVPGMNALGKYLARGLTLHHDTQIASVIQQGPRWQIIDDHDQTLGEFDYVIFAVPPVQAAQLLAPVCSEMAALLSQYRLAPCWAVMANLVEPLSVDWGGAFVNDGPVRWLARNQTKPGRAASPESLVIHASSEWSQLHIDDAPESVCNQLLMASSEALGLTLPPVSYCAAHRWRYAIAVDERPVPERAIVSPDGRLIACGDWASGSRVEGAFLSGCAAAGFVMRPHTFEV